MQVVVFILLSLSVGCSAVQQVTKGIGRIDARISYDSDAESFLGTDLLDKGSSEAKKEKLMMRRMIKPHQKAVGKERERERETEKQLDSPKRHAIALYGGVSGLDRTFQGRVGIMAKTSVNLTLPAVLLGRNLEGDADVFIHSWAPSLKAELEQLYHPKAAMFEDNEDYRSKLEATTKQLHGGSQLIQVSMSLSMSKVLTMVANYQSATQHTYEGVYLCRPDVLLRTRIDLKRAAAAEDYIYNTQGNGGRADFHFLMNGRNANSFSMIYESLPTLRLPVRPHNGWIQEFLSQRKLRTVEDGTVAGRDEEVYRKVPRIKSEEWRNQWLADLTPLFPPHCLDDFMSHHVRDECLVSVPN